MKAYRVTVKYWSYWLTPYESGFTTMERLFSTRERAEEWVKAIAHIKTNFEGKFMYRELTPAEVRNPNDYEPKFEITELEVDNTSRP